MFIACLVGLKMDATTLGNGWTLLPVVGYSHAYNAAVLLSGTYSKGYPHPLRGTWTRMSATWLFLTPKPRKPAKCLTGA